MEVPLKIGDVVSIRNLTDGGTLEGEGILDEDLTISSPPGNFDNCLFQLCVRTRVTAAEEFAELEEKHSKNAALRSDESSKMQLATLKRVKDKEAEMNKKTMQDKRGQTISYGDVVQLLHLRSEKFLTVSRTDVAKVEPENFQVGLVKDASTLSWFTLKPSAAFHNENDPVVDGSEVVFCVTVRDEEFLHMSTRGYSHVDWLKKAALTKKHPNQSVLEINSSLERTRFKMNRYCESVDPVAADSDLDKVPVKAGDIVALFDPQTRSYACCSNGKDSKDLTNKLVYEPSDNDETEPVKIPNTPGLFVIEMEHEELGGLIEWNSPIVLKQLNTGRFLSMGNDKESVVTVNDRNSETVCLELHPLPTTTLSDEEQSVFQNQAVFLRRQDRYLKAVESDGLQQAVVTSAEDLFTIPNDANALVLQVITDVDLLVDIRFGNCARPRLEVFSEELQRLSADNKSMLNSHSHFDAKVQSISQLTAKIQQFTCVGQHGVHNEPGNAETSLICMPHKQRLLQEQGILDLLVDIAEEALKVKRSLEAKLQSSSESHHTKQLADAAIRTIDVLCERCFSALRVALTQSPSNQLYLGDRFPVLLSFVGSGSAQSAMACITQMLDNIEIQQERVNEDEINLFIDMLRISPLNTPILNVFTVMCTCNGMAVEDNQCLLSEKLLQNNGDLLVQVDASSTNVQFKFPGQTQSVSAKQMTKKQIAFLSGQLYLLADMCFDRNYIAIREVEKQMNVGVAVSCIKSNDLPAQVRSAFVRLVTHLYVDRMPQKKDRIRNLTFPWSTIGGNQVSVSGGTHAGTFSDLQTTIADHIAGKEWTSLTEHLVGLLLKLLQFKFYNNKTPELRSVLQNIVSRLEAECDDANDLRLAISSRPKKAVASGVSKIPSKRNQGSKYHPSKIIPDDEDEEEYSELDDGNSSFSCWDLFSADSKKKLLKVLDSFRCIIFMVGLTIFSLIVDFCPPDIWTSETDTNGDVVTPDLLEAWNLLVFTVFAIELTLRFWAMSDPVGFFVGTKAERKKGGKDCVYRIMDFLVVSLDIVVLVAKGLLPINPKVLRIVRIFRLSKLSKIMRLMDRLRDEMNRKKEVPPWVLAKKFTQSPKEKLLAMTEMVHVLYQTSQIEQRFKLTGLLMAIKQESKTPAQQQEEKFPDGMYNSALTSGATLSWGSSNSTKDDILLHLILYDYSELVQVALSTLMLFHSGQGALVGDLRSAQLLAASVDENLYAKIESKLDQVSTELESFELWGTLETDADIAKGHSVKTILAELTRLCRSDSTSFITGGPRFEPNSQAQTMLRNLETMDAYLSWRDAVPYPAPEANDAEAILSREIRLLANQFLYWWIFQNVDNQDLAFAYLETVFTEDLKLSNVAGCSAVMSAILHGNERLIKLIPGNFVEMLCTHLKANKDPDALSLLASLTQIGRTPLKENQIKVMILLTDPNYKQDVLYLCSDSASDDHAERKALMQEVKTKENESAGGGGVGGPPVPLPGPSVAAMDDPMNADSVLGHLPLKLQYHVRLLDLLSACAAGGINIVEAKVQNLYPYTPLLEDLVAPETCMNIKIALAKLMFEAVVEVQVPVENLCQDMMMWEWMFSFPTVLGEATMHLQQLQQGGVSSVAQQMQCRHLMVYVFECILPSITHFFRAYYDPDDIPDDRRIKELPAQLAEAVSSFHKSAIGASIPQAIVSEETASTMKKYSGGVKGYVAVNSPVAKNRSLSTSAGDSTTEAKRYSVSAIVAESKTQEQTPLEVSLARRINLLAQSEEVMEGEKLDIESLLQFLKDLPRLASRDLPRDVVHLRLEPLLGKLVSHVLSFVNVQGDRKTLDARYVQTTVWTINLFRKMIEYDWKFTVDDRDDEGDDDSDENVRWIQDALDDAGATAMCLDLIAKGLTSEVKDGAIKLLMALLFQEGGNPKVQQTIHAHLNLPHCESFLREVKDTLARITAYHQSASGEDDSEEGPPGILLLKALQLSCEGHFLKNQDIIREQPNNEVSVNLLKPFVALLKDVSKFRGASSRGTIMSVLDLILEVLQGPCKGNQECLCQQTDLLETMNRMMREKAEDDPAFASGTDEDKEEIQEEMEEVKTTILCIFRALLEGQGNGQPSAIYRRVLSVLHLEVLQFLLNPPKLEMAGNLEAQIEEEERLEKQPLTPLQVQSLVLIKMLTGYNPALQDELTLSASVQKKMGTEVLSIEVVWNDTLEKKYFKRPEISSHLSKKAQDDIVEDVDRENQDKKLTDFVVRSKTVLEELEHMEFLEKFGISFLFNRTVQNYVTWVTFYINLAINALYLFNLSYVSDDSNALTDKSGIQKLFRSDMGASITEPGTWKQAWRNDDDAPMSDFLESTSGAGGLSHDFKTPTKCLHALNTNCYNLGDEGLEDLLQGLNVAQVCFSFFTLCLVMVVIVPVSYRLTMKETENDMFQSLWAAFLASLYYVYYLCFATLGMEVSPFYNTVLLLDLMKKDPTAGDVLQAVWLPREMLMVTVMLGIFVIYIFTFMIFFINSIRGQAEFLYGECDYLFKCLQWAVGFGMRNGGGLADYFNASSRYRMQYSYILDWAFFVVIVIIFMSILFGIIIDRFGQLREEKKEKLEDTTEICFICGIDKSDFDQLGGRVWQKHIGDEHNMWAYLKFMVFIWQQDQDDDDGLEQYVRSCLDTNDLRWYPHQKAMLFSEVQGDDGQDRSLLSAIEELQHKMHTELTKVQAHTNDQYKQIMEEISKLNEDQADNSQPDATAPSAKLDPLAAAK